ncbi:lipopolysaccharide assembly LapA domain-containing protein [Paenibacillus sp. MCAF9]|uniref:LapA family protein n=1 Tax=unclassified Paenibacillus TaxID=185978 RepID=UPI003F9A3D49
MKGPGILISALVFALLIAIFAVINIDSVHVNFLFTKATLPLILVILGSTLLGGLTVGLLGMIRQIRLQRTVKSLEKQLAEFQTEAELLGLSKATTRTEPSEEAAVPQKE